MNKKYKNTVEANQASKGEERNESEVTGSDSRSGVAVWHERVNDMVSIEREEGPSEEEHEEEEQEKEDAGGDDFGRVEATK